MRGTSGSLAHRSLVLLVTAVLVGCSTADRRAAVSNERVRAMAALQYQELKASTPVSEAPHLRREVECVVGSLAAQTRNGSPWEVTVFEGEEANAFSLPGNYLGVTVGLVQVAENQHQQAAAIGHEMAHVLKQHASARVSADVSLAVRRRQESEADLLGLELMARAGFDPRESIRFWANMGRVAHADSTHPSVERRVESLRERMPRAVALHHEARARGIHPACESANPGRFISTRHR